MVALPKGTYQGIHRDPEARSRQLMERLVVATAEVLHASQKLKVLLPLDAGLSLFHRLITILSAGLKGVKEYPSGEKFTNNDRSKVLSSLNAIRRLLYTSIDGFGTGDHDRRTTALQLFCELLMQDMPLRSFYCEAECKLRKVDLLDDDARRVEELQEDFTMTFEAQVRDRVFTFTFICDMTEGVTAQVKEATV